MERSQPQCEDLPKEGCKEKGERKKRGNEMNKYNNTNNNNKRERERERERERVAGSAFS